jgi:PAS domain S-box-containing protein
MRRKNSLGAAAGRLVRVALLTVALTVASAFGVDQSGWAGTGQVNALPAGAPGLWGQHPAFLMTVGVALVLMSILSTALILQVSRRKKVEASLRESEERLTFTAASTRTGLWQYDVSTGQLWTTKQSFALFGLDPNSTPKPTAFLRTVYPADRPIIGKAIQAARTARAELNISEFRIRFPDGQIRWILASSKTHVDANENPSIISGMLRDITPRKTAELQSDLLSERLATIQEEERQRIAQELHDSTVQHLAAAALSMIRVQDRVADDPLAQELCANVEHCLDDATKELRTYTYLLHPPQLAKDGLRLAVRRYVEGFARRTALKADLRISRKVDQLPLPKQRALLRIVQEALANVHRHASASQVIVSIKCVGGQIHLVVSDNGKGMPGAVNGQRSKPARAGVGIPGMTARLRRLGGDLKILSGAGGTTLHGTMPADLRQPAVTRPTPPPEAHA